MKDTSSPSTSETTSPEQVYPAIARSEPSVPPSEPCMLASIDGNGMQKLKKGEKLLTMEDLRECIEASHQKVSISVLILDGIKLCDIAHP